LNKNQENRVPSLEAVDPLNPDIDYKKITHFERNGFKKKLNLYYSNDKYWPKRNRKMQIRELKVYQELRYFEKSYKDWLYYHLEYGCPTFFSILGTDLNVNMKRLKEIYQFKRENSYIPKYIIEEAYKTIKNVQLRSKYNRFIKMFSNYYNLLEEEERTELDNKHSDWLYYEKKKIILSLILERHKNWELLYVTGINLFSITNIKHSYKMEDIIALYKKYLKDTSEKNKILAFITKKFLNSFVYQEYRTFLSIFPTFFLKKKKNQVSMKLQNHWLKMNFKLTDFCDILLSEEPLMEKIEKHRSILSKNYNWIEYIPPNKKTLYQVLDIDNKNLDLSSKENIETKNKDLQIRDLLFKKFKSAQKSPETNLAYTTLRNSQIRSDYNWMLKYNLVLMKILFLLQIDKLNHKSLNQMVKGKRNIEDLLRPSDLLKN